MCPSAVGQGPEKTQEQQRAPFAGFALVNSGGDYALREITIRGTKEP